MAEIAVEMNRVAVTFGAKTYLDAFSLKLPTGKWGVLTGPSGTGKTTLFHALLGFYLPPPPAQIKINELPLTAAHLKTIRNQIGWLPQHPIADQTTVTDFLFNPFHFKHNRPQTPRTEPIEQYLSKLGLESSLLQKKMEHLSGGQRQKIALIQLLLLNRSILLLDEPTSALDAESKIMLVDLLKTHHKTTLLSISHDAWWIDQMECHFQIPPHGH